MTEGILFKIIAEIGEADSDARAEKYTMVNVRPGEKVAVMLDLLARLSSKTPSAVVAGAISRRLAEYAASSSAYADVILDVAEDALKQSGASGFQANSALDILKKAGIVELQRPQKTFFK